MKSHSFVREQPGSFSMGKLHYFLSNREVNANKKNILQIGPNHHIGKQSHLNYRRNRTLVHQALWLALEFHILLEFYNFSFFLTNFCVHEICGLITRSKSSTTLSSSALCL